MYKIHKAEVNLSELNFLSNFRYKILSVIGTGGFCKVYKAKDMKSNTTVAIKKIDNSKPVFRGSQAERFKYKMRKIMEKEAHILQCVTHLNIIKLLDFYSDATDIFIVLEYAAGGELFEVISSNGSLSEHDAAFILIQLMRAVDYLHGRGFIHRDIKLENMLLESRNIKSVLKLCDFGISRGLRDIMFTNCGTLDYSAPELLRNRNTFCGYTKKIDNWSIGVTGYILLCGYTPFYSMTGNTKEMIQQILECNYKFDSPKWDDISKQAKELISSLLQEDPNTRISLSDAIDSDFMKINCKFLSYDESVKTNFP